MVMRHLAPALIAIFAALPAAADGFRQIADRDHFLTVMEGRSLTRLGIRLDVTSAGEIRGKAFGTPVSGAWRWEGGYFCRDLYYGNRDLGANCQMVKVRGETVRFISDQGAGQYADLRLD